MSGKKYEHVSIRLGESHIRFLKYVISENEAEDRSSAVRFCIEFTEKMFTLLPAALFEAITEIDQERLAERERNKSHS